MYSTEDFHLPSYTMGKSNEVTKVMLSFIPKYFAENVQDIKKAAKEKQNYEVDIDSAKGEYLFLLDRSGSIGGKRM